MSELRYTTDKPTKPGWYWARNVGDSPGEMWEAIVYVSRYGTISPGRASPDGLCISWMTAAGEVGVMHERDWSDECEWAGPIAPPGNTDKFRGRPVTQEP